MFGVAGNAQSFQESVTIITKDRVVYKDGSSKGLTAKSLQLVSNTTKFKLPVAIVIDDLKFSDDGSGNDLRAADGIYTTSIGFAASTTRFVSKSYAYEVNTNPSNPENKNTIDCNFKYFYEIPYLSCRIHIEW